MKTATLLFLVKRSGERVTDICLAMKKRGFGAGRWNGAGGKVEGGETVEEALVRETVEEIGVTPLGFYKIAELHFTFPHNPGWDQVVHAYFCERWSGEPRESEEMAPRWFKAGEIPYEDMWPDDLYWLPRAIDGKVIKKASFTFGEKDAVIAQSVEELAAI